MKKSILFVLFIGLSTNVILHGSPISDAKNFIKNNWQCYSKGTGPGCTPEKKMKLRAAATLLKLAGIVITVIGTQVAFREFKKRKKEAEEESVREAYGPLRELTQLQSKARQLLIRPGLPKVPALDRIAIAQALLKNDLDGLKREMREYDEKIQGLLNQIRINKPLREAFSEARRDNFPGYDKDIEKFFKTIAREMEVKVRD